MSLSWIYGVSYLLRLCSKGIVQALPGGLSIARILLCAEHLALLLHPFHEMMQALLCSGHIHSFSLVRLRRSRCRRVRRQARWV